MLYENIKIKIDSPKFCTDQVAPDTFVLRVPTLTVYEEKKK